MKKKLPILIFVLAGFFILLALFQPEQQSNKKSGETVLSRQDREERVNRHLLLTHKKIELAREQARIQSAKTPRVGQQILPPSQFENLSENFTQPRQDGTSAVASELGASNQFAIPSARDQILKQQHQQEQNQKLEQSALKAYVQEFIANARRAGYELEVDENFVVRRVTPIGGGASVPTEFNILSESRNSK